LPKILVIGGAGDIGQGVVRDLFENSQNTIIIADYNAEKAKRVASNYSSSRVTSEFVDVNDLGQTIDLLGGCDVVVNCSGPFYKLAHKVLNAAIRVGVDYLDVCDDPDATERLLSMDRMAREAGITAVVGMGWTPGLSNILAKRIVEEHPDVSGLDIHWVGSTADAEGAAVVKHVLHVIQSPCWAYHGGEWVEVAPLTGHREVVFPEPIGKQRAYYVGHPEPLTLPRFLKGVRDVDLRGVLLPPEVNSLGELFAKLGFIDTPEKIDVLAEVLRASLPLLSKLGEKGAIPLSGVRVDGYVGEGVGKRVVASLACVDSMQRITGIPASVGTLTLLGSGVHEGGVLPPEGAFRDTKRFLDELAMRDVQIEVMAG